MTPNMDEIPGLIIETSVDGWLDDEEMGYSGQTVDELHTTASAVLGEVPQLVRRLESAFMMTLSMLQASAREFERAR